MERSGSNVNPIACFSAGIPFEGEIDVEWFCNITGPTVAQKRLDFLRAPKNVYELRKRGYGGPALNRMWKAVFRGCIVHGIPIPGSLTHLAEELGVIVP